MCLLLRQLSHALRRGGLGTTRMAAHRAHRYVPEADMEKLQSTIKQFVREWGAEGAPERECAHRPALDALRMALPGGAARGDRVLLPGSGMGRLAWECANLGYTVPENVQKAVAKQLEELPFVYGGLANCEPRPRLASLLSEIMPGDLVAT